MESADFAVHNWKQLLQLFWLLKHKVELVYTVWLVRYGIIAEEGSNQAKQAKEAKKRQIKSFSL